MRNVLEAKQPPKEEGPDYAGLTQMLEDFVLVASHLAPLADDKEHMIAVAKAAISDQVQLRFLANVLQKVKK